MSTQHPARACPVCGSIHHRLFPLCGVHERRLERHGSPTGRAITHADLKPYRPIAQGMLRKYAAERAVIAIHSLMQSLLTGYGADSAHATPGRKVRPHLDILVASGATPRSCLEELLSVALYWQLGELLPTAAEMDCALARRLLVHRKLKGVSTHKFRRKVISSLGYVIRCDLLPTLFQMSQHYIRSVKTHDEQRLAAREFNPAF
jgi:hypothetical protein